MGFLDFLGVISEWLIQTLISLLISFAPLLMRYQNNRESHGNFFFDILMTSRDHMMTSRDHLGRPNSEITFLSLAHRKINLYMRYGAQMKGLG